MTAIRSDCPDEATVRAFLQDSYNAVDHDAVEDHISECERCQVRLAENADAHWRDLLPQDGVLSVDGTDLTVIRPEHRRASLQGKKATAPFELSDVTKTSIGRYELVSELARGGMGVVYEAIDSQLGRTVAIKVLSSDRAHDEGWLRRFQREARLTSALNHPNIVTIHEIGKLDQLPFLVTELVEGMTLEHRLQGGPLSVSDAISYSQQIASGMQAAHASGIIHRDLKPANVMIRDDGFVKILDFGLARTSTDSEIGSLEVSLSGSGMVIGTVRYMSPEQARGTPLDISSDIFSFGTMLYYMLTGAQPFPGDTPGDVLATILTRAPKPISESGAAFPASLLRLVMRCLDKKATHRPTAAEIQKELSEIDGSQVSQRRTESESATGDASPMAQTSPTTASGLSDTEPLSTPGEPGPIQYACSGDVNIAWQEIGSGPIDVVFVMGWVSHLEWFWKHPAFASFLQRLASFSRVILFDKRGTGLSDKVPVKELPTLETRMDDVRAVMDAAGSERAVLVGVSEGGPLCTLFAATYPQKTIAIAMIGCYARRLWAEDYPWGPTAEQREVFLDELRQHWGGPLGIEDRAPSAASDPEFREWWASYLRMGASPGAAVALTRMNAQIDVRPILPSIQVPTLVIHRTGDRCLLVEEGRHMASLIPGAKFVELPGDDHLPFVGDSAAVLDEIEEFLTGKRHAPEVDRVLATVLHITVETGVSSAQSNQSLQQFHTLVQGQAELFRGGNLIAEDARIILTFDGPARAIRAARAICGLATRLDIDLRCGLDTGPCDIGPSVASGPPVDHAASLASAAALQAVLISDAVLHLVSGSGLDFIEGSTVTTAEGGQRATYQLVQ